MKKILFIFCLFFFGGLSVHSQSTERSPAKKKIDLISPLEKLEIGIPKVQNFQPSTIHQRSIFDVEKLPIFCKIEHKLAKKSKINVMMRLGSLDYVNKLEGK